MVSSYRAAPSYQHLNLTHYPQIKKSRFWTLKRLVEGSDYSAQDAKDPFHDGKYRASNNEYYAYSISNTHAWDARFDSRATTKMPSRTSTQVTPRFL
ncbi:hypothetical protein FRC18_002436 [Serendipita sp. 400]|nr:hypothetical protein FRC18_002436 [Serendipita sp. 400]